MRNEVAHYVDRCMAAGFCKTEDDIRACAGRYLAGKRKVTAPGTARRLRDWGLESSPSTILKALPIAIQRSELWCFSLAF